MIQLLFLVLFAEGVVALFLLVKIGPLRELVMKGLDQVKMGKGPATVKTIAGTMSVILLSNFFSIVKIQNKGAKLGSMSPMDQVLWRTHLLEASLMGMAEFIDGFLQSHGLEKYSIAFQAEEVDMIVLVHMTDKGFRNTNGFCLFLGFLIDRMHHYLQKLIGIKGKIEASKDEVEKLEKEKLLLKEKEQKASKEKEVLLKEICNLKENLNKLKLECEEKDKRVETAEAHVASLQKQSADLLLEYDRLLEDNQNLQSQALGSRT